MNHTHLASPLAFGTNSVSFLSSASCILPVKKLNRLSPEFDLLISGYIGIFTICIKSGQALSCYAQVTGWCLVHAFKLLLRLRGGRKHLRRQRKPSMVFGFKLIIEQNGKFCRLQTTYSIFLKETYFNFPRNNFGGRNPNRTPWEFLLLWIVVQMMRNKQNMV